MSFFVILVLLAALLLGVIAFLTTPPEILSHRLYRLRKPFFFLIGVILSIYGLWWAALPFFLFVFLPNPQARRQSREGPSGQHARRHDGAMSWEEACEILRVRGDATKKEINASYKRLMQEIHPDKGGSSFLAARLNEARDILLKRASG